MNPLKSLGDVVSSVLGLLLVGWFGMTCLKLGWYARENPFLRPVVGTVLGLETVAEDKPNLIERATQLFE